MSVLTTHVLDTTRGCPARGMKIELWSIDQAKKLKTVTTNDDGRVDSPLLREDEMLPGTYELVFLVGDYFGERRFLDQVPVRFKISDASAKYHIPLLISPWSFTPPTAPVKMKLQAPTTQHPEKHQNRKINQPLAAIGA